MAVFVAAVTGSERPWGSLYLFGRLIFVFLTAFCISADRFLFGSPSSSLAFSFIRYLYIPFSLACLSRATSSTGCPEYAWKDICYWLMWLAPGLLQEASPSPGHKICSLMSPQAIGSWDEPRGWPLLTRQGCQTLMTEEAVANVVSAEGCESRLQTVPETQTRPWSSLNRPGTQGPSLCCSGGSFCGPWRGLLLWGAFPAFLACTPASQILFLVGQKGPCSHNQVKAAFFWVATRLWWYT